MFAGVATFEGEATLVVIRTTREEAGFAIRAAMVQSNTEWTNGDLGAAEDLTRESEDAGELVFSVCEVAA